VARSLKIHDSGRILRTEWGWVVAAVAICVATALVATNRQKPSYTASARMFVSSSPPKGFQAASSDYAALTQRLQSYVGIVDSPRVLVPVISSLHLRETPATLASQVSATSTANTVLMEVTATQPTAKRASTIANAVSQQFAFVIEQLETPRTASAPRINVSVVQPATTPSKPSSPKKPLNLALGALIGLALGIAIALWRARADTSVVSPDEAAEEFGLPVLGAIPSEKKRPWRSSNTLRPEAYRQLRTTLRLHQDGRSGGVLAVTSSVRGEGRTTTACSLAVAVAELGMNVTLVEADLRHPSVAQHFGVTDRPGLVDLLSGVASLPDVRRGFPSHASLTVVTAGTTHPNPTEILDSVEMRNCIAALEGCNDVVILDTPALLPSADASIVATMATSVLVVVAVGRTPREKIKAALARLRGVDACVSGVVMNFASAGASEGYRSKKARSSAEEGFATQQPATRRP
jgi:tyrosine-protein kinase